MKPLRIALFHNLHSGGAKRVAAGHLESLAERHDVTLYSLSGADHDFGSTSPARRYRVQMYEPSSLAMLRSPFGRINPALRICNARRMDALGRRIAADIDAVKPDVVLLHPCQMTAAPTVLRWLRSPSVYYLHEWPRTLYEPPIVRPHDADGATAARTRFRRALNGFDPLLSISASYFRALDRSSVRAATRVLTNSRFTRDNAVPAYGRGIDICYLGVTAAATAPPPSGSGRRQRVVLSVGSLTPAKGFDFLVDALAAGPADPDGARPRLVIISNFQEPLEREYIEARANAAGVPLTLLTGVSDADLREWYAVAGCVAYAPVREPFGLVAIEAMAAGAPLVAVAEGGVSESVIDGVSGVVAPRDPRVFGATLRRLLDDPDEAERLGARARAHAAAHWTWSRHMERLESALDEVATSASPSVRRQ